MKLDKKLASLFCSCNKITYSVCKKKKKESEMQYLDAISKNDRMICVRFQGKPFNITLIQVYTLTSNAEEAEVERVCEDLQDLLELIPKRCPFHHRSLECKRRKS